MRKRLEAGLLAVAMMISSLSPALASSANSTAPELNDLSEASAYWTRADFHVPTVDSQFASALKARAIRVLPSS